MTESQALDRDAVLMQVVWLAVLHRLKMTDTSYAESGMMTHVEGTSCLLITSVPIRLNSQLELESTNNSSRQGLTKSRQQCVKMTCISAICLLGLPAC